MSTRGKPTGLLDRSEREIHIGDVVVSLSPSKYRPSLGIVVKSSSTKIGIARIRPNLFNPRAYAAHGEDETLPNVKNAPRSSLTSDYLIINQDTMDLPYIKRTVALALENQ